MEGVQLLMQKYTTIEVHVWESNDGSIHLTSNDQRITDHNGRWKRMNIQISRRRQPRTDAWLRLLLLRHGQPTTAVQELTSALIGLDPASSEKVRGE